MSVEKKVFGTAPSGETVYLYSISNQNGMRAEVTNYGAILVSLFVTDHNGKCKDVVLGYDNVEAYVANPSFFGATVGPCANRTANASIMVDGITYQIDDNDGSNNLHSHKQLGFHKRLWKAEVAEDSVRFTIEDTDGNLGFPGHKKCSLTYSLNEKNQLSLCYHGESDKNTIINLTNHTYFNLKGQGEGNIEDHLVQLKASRYTPVDAGSIPLGELAAVQGTPMDFLTATPVGAHIGDDFEQLHLTGGYDHNYVIDDVDGTVKLFAKVTSPDHSLVMKAYTDLPGVQFYAGNFIEPEAGKAGAAYGKRSGLCLETQFFPDSVHHPDFPSVIFGPDRAYDHTTIYEFD